MRLHRLTVIAACAGLGSCASVRGDLDLTTLADELQRKDVVFLGENHENSVDHLQQVYLLRLLHERRGDVVLSMEMFERDVQPVLDGYLAGDLDEARFLDDARPWKNYHRHYRPLVEYCKRNGLPVIAANVPRSLARRVAGDGLAAADGNPHAARNVSAPRDAYWTAFQVSMTEHPNVTEQSLWRFYESQCLKDDTMAESITDYLAARSGTRPLVVHLCGRFHSDDRLGTVARVESRMPDLDVAVVGSREVANVVRKGGGDYEWIVPEEPKFAERGLPGEIPHTKPDPEGPALGTAASEADDAVDFGARPALGFMPGYDDAVEGVLVESLRPDGPADRAGIEDGDIIVQVGDSDIRSLGDYLAVLGDLQIGRVVRVSVDRAGKALEFDVKVGERID